MDNLHLKFYTEYEYSDHTQKFWARCYIISNFFFGPFSTLGNCPYKLVRCPNPAFLNSHYVELFLWSFQRFLGLFSIRYLESFHFTHSNVERKLWSNVYLFLFQQSSKSIKRKLIVKCLREKSQALKALGSGLTKKLIKIWCT